MRVEIQLGTRLGNLRKNLEIEPDSRISVGQLDHNGQLEIWDLTTGRYFTLTSLFTSTPSVSVAHVTTPTWVQEIIDAPDDQLLAEFHSTWMEGAGEKRMAIFTELCLRGVNTLERG